MQLLLVRDKQLQMYGYNMPYNKVVYTWNNVEACLLHCMAYHTHSLKLHKNIYYRKVAQCVILRYCLHHTLSRVSCHVMWCMRLYLMHHMTCMIHAWDFISCMYQSCIMNKVIYNVSLRYCLHVFCRYGFDYGSAHFVLMSTEHFFDPTSPQYQFLDAHLKSVDRSRTPWLIFAGHRYKACVAHRSRVTYITQTEYHEAVRTYGVQEITRDYYI